MTNITGIWGWPSAVEWEVDVQVFRVEKAQDDFGPYYPREESEGFYHPDLTHFHSPDRPVPWRDFDWIEKDILVDGRSGFDKIRFGFSNINQLRDWFDEGMRKFLKKKGYMIAIYEATVLDSTPYQVAIDWTQAEFTAYRDFDLRLPPD